MNAISLTGWYQWRLKLTLLSISTFQKNFSRVRFLITIVKWLGTACSAEEFNIPNTASKIKIFFRIKYYYRTLSLVRTVTSVSSRARENPCSVIHLLSLPHHHFQCAQSLFDLMCDQLRFIAHLDPKEMIVWWIFKVRSKDNSLRFFLNKASKRAPFIAWPPSSIPSIMDRHIVLVRSLLQHVLRQSN